MATKKNGRGEIGNYGCMLCAAMFMYQDDQARHWVEIHGRKTAAKQPESLTCEYCSERFRTKDGLDHHLQAYHQKTLI